MIPFFFSAVLPLATATQPGATQPGDGSENAAVKDPPWHFNPQDWMAPSDALFRGLIGVGITLVAGVILLLILRRLFKKLRLGLPAAAGVLTLALYVGLHQAHAARMADPRDTLTLWFNRAFAAVFVIVGLRMLDRIAIVPLLTRGGKIEMPRLLHQIVNIVLAILAILVYASNAFDLNINSFLAGSAVVSIVLGLALQETLSNFISGMVMQGSPPFSLGDYVVIGSYRGRVVDINWRAVTLHMNDDNYVIIPNSTVAKSELTNMHSPSRVSAWYVTVGVEYDVPPCDVIDVLKLAAIESPGILKEPAPVAMVSDFGDSAVMYTIKLWLDEPVRNVPILAGVRRNIWYRLREKDYTIPFPMQVQVSEKVRNRAADIRRRVEAFDNVPLLSPLSAQQKNALAEGARDVAFGPGQTLFKQGDAGETFYIVCRGKVDVLIDLPGGGHKSVATLGPGDFFGEMSALTGQPRTATIRAVEPLVVLEIDKEDLHGVFAADPSVLEKISEIIARRNAEREALAKGAATAAMAEATTSEKNSLLGRMMKFFRLR